MSEQGSVDPWVVQEPKKPFEQLPVGFYVGMFKGVEDVKVKPTREGDTGERWRFKWEVSSGEHQGKIASALTDKTISTNTQTGVLISGLLGRQLVSGESVKGAIDACQGKVCMVGVQPGPKGGKPQVRSCGLPPQM